MIDIGWNYPKDESDQWDGFNDSGIEHFRGRPLMHLARETIQNAMDAGNTVTVKVKICLDIVNTESVPNIDELRKNMKYCYEASINEGDKANIFFKNANAELKKNRINVLEISDFNTAGMMGPSVNGTPFYAYMKARGQSRKPSETASGSYGIGKYAPYAVSNIRTIFVSTVYVDDVGEKKQLTQGKSILISHDEGNIRRTGTGFWGIKEKCKPAEGIKPFLPTWLQRANKDSEIDYPGTKLSILCFEPENNWQEILAASVAENFFGSISEGKLEVHVNEKYIINKNNITHVFNNEEIRGSIKNLPDEPEQFDISEQYLEALKNNTDVIIEESESQELGHIEVRILIEEGMPKKVCALRNGMFITDRLNRLKTFSDFKDFVAVFQCRSNKGNELLRAMEPPRHDNFEPARLSTKDDQKKGERALRDLAEWIRNMLKRHAKEPVSEVTEIDELRDYFYEEGEEGTGRGTEEINPYGEVLIRAKPFKLKSTYSTIVSKKGSAGVDGKGGRRSGSGKGNGGSSGKRAQRALVVLKNVRAVKIDEKSRRFAFTPEYTGKISLSIYEAGADYDNRIEITKAKSGKLINGRLVLDVENGKRYTNDLTFSNNLTSAVKVVAYEI